MSALEDLLDMWRDGWPAKILILLILGIVALIPIGIYFAVQEEQDWERFKVAHKCRVVSYQASSSTVGIGTTSDGKTGTVVITQPSKTGWLCDDGVTYYR